MGFLADLFFRRLGTNVAQAKRHWLNELARKTELVALANAPDQALVRVTGLARPLEEARVVEAPLTGRRCIAYCVSVVAHTGGFSNDSQSQILLDECLVPFLLHDGEQVAVVDPRNAEVACVWDHTSSSLAAFDANPRQRAVLTHHKLIDRDWFNTHHLTYREAVLDIGERVTVRGYIVRDLDSSAQVTATDYRTATATRWHISGTVDEPLLVTDDRFARLPDES